LKSYADILYRWGLLEKRSEILKFVQGETTLPFSGIVLDPSCRICGRNSSSIKCTNCQSFAIRCAICRVSVKGLSSFCLVCGHGGHEMHMRDWFKKFEFCPLGCGCNCLQHMQTPIDITSLSTVTSEKAAVESSEMPRVGSKSNLHKTALYTTTSSNLYNNSEC